MAGGSQYVAVEFRLDCIFTWVAYSTYVFLCFDLPCVSSAFSIHYRNMQFFCDALFSARFLNEWTTLNVENYGLAIFMALKGN